MTDREPGSFWWVKEKNGSQFKPAHYDGRFWLVLGYGYRILREHLSEIGPKIEPPKEGLDKPPMVPSYPIAGDGDGGTFVDIPGKPDASQRRD